MIASASLFGALAAAALASAASTFQLPLQAGPAGLSAESSPAGLSFDVHTTIFDPEVSQDHSVRIKKTQHFCNDSTTLYTGYLDAPSRHLFFWFAESRRDPDKDDLMLWTNGGPGCASEMGLFMELGPCQIADDAQSAYSNPYSWTETANVIFIDQPVNVGFSYSTEGLAVGSSEDAAKDVATFMQLFTKAFKSFKGRPFHLAGESYGGQYIPHFATEILHRNAKLHANATDESINLQSVLIGNGITDAMSMTTSYYTQSCTKESGIGHPVLDVASCMQMQQLVHKCDKWTQRVCRDRYEQPDCEIAADWCAEAFEGPFIRAQINPYDISKPCTTLGEDLCYPETKKVSKFLDRPDVRKAIGVDEHIGNYKGCSDKVMKGFILSRDRLSPTFYHLTALLEHNVKVLIYAGTYDWICNYHGNRKLVESLEWSGQEAFKAQELRPWSVGEAKTAAGEVKQHGGLTYMTVFGAGHMVPMDKPAEASHMVKSWLENKDM